MAHPVQNEQSRPGPLPLPPTITVSTGSGSASATVGSNGAEKHTPSLASLSRNTSVISSSSSSSSTSSLVAPIRPRPLRSFSQSPSPPGVGRRARSPHSPTTPRHAYVPPSYLTHQLGLSAAAPADSGPTTSYGANTYLPPLLPPSGGAAPGTGSQINNNAADPNRAATISSTLAGANTRPQPVQRTRTSSAVKKMYSATDFDFGEPLGDGSYSTVSLVPLWPCAVPCRRRPACVVTFFPCALCLGYT